MRWLMGLLVACCLGAQPLPNLGFGSVNAGMAWFGPKTLYPGYAHYFLFPVAKWRVPVTCAASGNTCDTAGSGYTPTGSETNVLVTADTLPTGMDFTETQYRFANYKICNVSGTTFQLGQANACTTLESFSSTGTNVSILINQSAHTYITSNTGWPAGTTLTWSYPASAGVGWGQNAYTSPNGNPYNYLHGQLMMLKAVIPANAAPGDYPISIVSCTTDTTGGTCAGLSDTLAFTESVTALTYLSDANEVTSFPAITGLSTWVSYMTDATNGGGKWCDKTTGATNPTNLVGGAGTDANVSYYDGGASYWRIANYTHDADWLNCTQNILQQMLYGNSNSGNVGYILPANGSVPSWRVFPVGYAMAVSQDARYIAGPEYYAGLVHGGGTSWINGCSANEYYIRENAYALDTFLTVDRMGVTPKDAAGVNANSTWSAREQRCADELVQILDAYVNGTYRYNAQQYFMEGLATTALIHWWQRTKDPRVPIVVKATLDAYYSNYSIANHKAMWVPDASGTPRCNNSVLWYNPDVTGHCQDITSANLTDLHDLFVPAFAWYWRISGDDTYRTEGDEVFSHEFDNSAFNYIGKTFNQAYKDSFNYVGWRQGWLSPEKSIE